MTENVSPVDPVQDAGALRALAFLGAPPADWVAPRPGIDHDVAIIGAGHNGVALSFALRRLGVHKTTLVDAAPEGRTGVWRHPARMNVLRTPKAIGGPELGIPELSFRYWFEQRHGADAWDGITFIKRTDWADYLDWFRAIVDVHARHETRLTLVEPTGEHFRLTFSTNGQETVETARKLVFTSGIVSFGGAFVPEFVSDALPRPFWAHTSEAIDFAALRGKSVAVLGSAASAFDAAAVALEHGAERVHLFSRRSEISRLVPGRLRAYPGAINNFHRLPDADRWRFNLLAKRAGVTPPREALLRVLKHGNFHLHLNAAWEGLRVEDEKVHLTSGNEAFEFDFVIAGTGYRVDASRQAELRPIADDIALWADRYTPPPAEVDDELGRHPYLGPEYQLQEKVPGKAPYLKNIHVFTAAGSLSFGRPVGDIPSMANGIPAISNAIVRDLYFEDYETHMARAAQPAPFDFEAELYAPAIWTGEKRVAAE